MTASTSDERREVARKIREYVDAYGDKIEDAEMVLFGTVWRRGEFNEVVRPTSAVELLAMVADLIDPTCHFEESPDNDEFAIRVVSGYICHSCGHETIVERTAGGWAEPPHFCSNCGARVVSDDDQ